MTFLSRSALFAAFALAVTLFSLPSSAMPVNPEPRFITQPDGSQFQVRPHGDEHLLWFVRVDTGDIVMFNRDAGRYEYAELVENLQGTFLRPSGLKLGATNPPSLPKVDFQDAAKAWRDAWKRFSIEQGVLSEDGGETAPAASGATEGGESSDGGEVAGASAASSTGPHHYNTLFVMVEFTDYQFVSGEQAWSDKIFGGYPGPFIAGSMNDYYDEMADGKVVFAPAAENQGTANDGFVKVQMNYPHPQHARNWSGWRPVLTEAFNAAASHVDFSQFDSNGNGVIDKTELLVSFIVAGRESSYSGSETEGFWGHAYFSHNFGSFDGVSVSTGYMGFGERQGPTEAPYDSTIGIIAHEFGHSAFNLRDLYNQPSAISYWGLMGTGSWGYKPNTQLGSSPVHMTGYSKINAQLPNNQRGFVQPTTIYARQNAQQHDLGHPFSGDYKVYKVYGINAAQYWVLDQRKAQGYDEGLLRNGNAGVTAGDTGMMVSYAMSSSSLYIYRANGQTGGTRSTDLLYAGNVDTLSPETTPNTNFPQGDYSGLVVESVSAPMDVMNFQLRYEQADCQTFTSTNPSHETAGRAYSVEEGTWWKTKRFYAVGSGEDLGTSTWSNVTLAETSPGYFTTGSCPAQDYTPPVLTLQGDVIDEIPLGNNGSGYQEPGYTATDDIDGDITNRVNWSGYINVNEPGDYYRTYIVKDNAGNWSEEQVRTIRVVDESEDTIAPVITLSGGSEVTITVGDSWVDPGYSATDDRDGNITANVVVTGSVDANTVGDYTLYYNVSDAAGNAGQQVSRLVHVVEETVDTTPPVITLSGSAQITLTVGDTWAEPGYTATDDTDGDITANVVVTGSVNTANAGVYTLYYNVSDAAGNAAAEMTRTVTVEEAGFECMDYYASNYTHVQQGRATSSNWYAYTVGSNESLGLNNTYTYTTVREVSPGYFEKGACN